MHKANQRIENIFHNSARPGLDRRGDLLAREQIILQLSIFEVALLGNDTDLVIGPVVFGEQCIR